MHKDGSYFSAGFNLRTAPGARRSRTHKVFLQFLMWLLLICSLFHPRFCSDGSVPPPPRCSRHHRAPRRIHACDKSKGFIYQAGLFVGIIHHACSTGVIDRRRGSVGQTGHVLCLRVTEAARTCRTCLFHSLVSNADVIVCEHMNLFHPSFFLGFEKKKFLNQLRMAV